MRLKNTFVLATIGAMLCAATAVANDFRTRQSGNWSNSNTWEEFTGSWGTTTNIPGVGDDVLIRPSHTASVDQAVTVDSLHIADDGVVDFGSAVTLKITDPSGLDVDPAGDATDPGKLDVNVANARLTLSGGGTPTIDGELVLSANPSYLRIDDANATLGGSGMLSMTDANATIEIEDGFSLTVGANLTLRGMGTIGSYDSGSATLVNGGVVEANAAGVLALNSDLALDDPNTANQATWRVSNASATMRFNQDATSLFGAFVFTAAGDFDVQTFDIATAGDLTCFTGAQILIQSGGSFDAGNTSQFTSTHTCP